MHVVHFLFQKQDIVPVFLMLEFLILKILLKTHFRKISTISFFFFFKKRQDIKKTSKKGEVLSEEGCHLHAN